jgi:hypothetical protein
MEVDLYKENKSLHASLDKLTRYLEVHDPMLLCSIEKVDIFDESAEVHDMESGSCDPSADQKVSDASNNSSNTGTECSHRYKVGMVNLDGELSAENGWKLTIETQHEREREKLIVQHQQYGTRPSRRGDHQGMQRNFEKYG